MSAEHHYRLSGGGLDRRTFLAGAAAGAVGGGVLAWGASQFIGAGHGGHKHEVKIARPTGALGIPGPFPGRVIEVNHPQAAKGNVRNREAVKSMVDRGMQELVGSDDAVEAWRYFFKPGDRVGIKVVPVGEPDSISSHEVVQEVIDGLKAAKVDLKDILIFDRYQKEFTKCGYDKLAEKEKVHWECESFEYDDLQTRLDGQPANGMRSKHVSGYDRDVYRTLAFCTPQHDPKDDRSFRSHLSMIISQKIDKYIGIPVLKDHRSAGITLALKNLSHGSVNNVCRSHISTWNAANEPYKPGMTLNQCGTFIPAIVSLPRIREKAVLHIGDGLVATYEGGPGAWNFTFKTWNYNSLLFGTDPVAMDHIGWQIIDQKRAEMGLPAVASMGLEGNYGLPPKDGGRTRVSEQFQMRQPEHIPLAATLGLGVFARHLIHHKRFDLA